MADLRDRIYHRRSSVVSKRPTVLDIDDGELAINYNSSDPGLYFKDIDESGSVRNIRKIGPIHFGPNPPNFLSGSLNYENELSNGECWIDTSAGEGRYLLKVWRIGEGNNKGWVEVSSIYAKTDLNLDQFANGNDGDNIVHTDGIRVKINNKSALVGYSSTDEYGNILVINENSAFQEGVELNGGITFKLSAETFDNISEKIKLKSFKPHEGFSLTTSEAESNGVKTTFKTATPHGLFNGELVFVENTDITGEYIIDDSTSDSFSLRFNGGNEYLNIQSNVDIKYAPEIIIDENRNLISSGNFGIKTIDDVINLDSNQLSENYWDVFHNPTNKNTRIYARVGNNINQIETSILSIDVQNSGNQEIKKGDPVIYSGKNFGVQIALINKAFASNTLNQTKIRAIGVAGMDIVPGSKGTVILLGEVSGINTKSIPGAIIGGSNIGRVLFLKEDGGLTFTRPLTDYNLIQQIGIVVNDDEENGIILVNHPNSFVELPDLPKDYIWIGDTNNAAVAHKLVGTSFKRTWDENEEIWKIELKDNLEFGSYIFSSEDPNEGRIVETKVTSFSIGENSDPSLYEIVETFPVTYRTAKYIVQISGFTSTNLPIYKASEILIVHDGVEAFVVEYGTVSTQEDRKLGEFDAIIDQGNVVLRFKKYPLITQELRIKSLRTSLLV